MQAAFFDLDKTIVARSSGLALGRDLYREGFITKRLLLRGIAAQFVYLLVGADEDKMEKMRERALAMTRGWEKARIVQLVDEVMGEVIIPTIYKEAADLIERHHQEGRQVYIVSSSPEEIVVPLGDLLEVDGVIASRGKVDREGRYVGQLEFYCYGDNKADAIRKEAEARGIDLFSSFAYSDSATDVPMLEVVGNPVAVNPDRTLRRIALERGWPVVRFQSPVTLRKRLASFTPSHRVGLVGSGVALSLVAAVWYMWLKRRSEESGSA